MAVTWNFENAAHLLRRAAFGGTTEEIQAFVLAHADVGEAVDDLLSFATSSKRPPKGGNDFYGAKFKQAKWWLKTMLKAKAPKDALREKLVLYWHGHLCSGFNKQESYGSSNTAIQNGLFRRYAKGNFRDLVRDFNRDPANLVYLDGIINYATNDGVHVAANENFGREIMELFTLGISQFDALGSNDPTKPNYSESDVHNLARALTGWTYIDKTVGVWNQDHWDGGQYDDDGDDLPDDVTIFGVTNNNYKIGSLDDLPAPADDVLQILLDREDDAGNKQVAMFVCRKLWTYFAYPAPAPGLKTLLEGFAAILVASDWEIAPVLDAMFNHDEFYSSRAKTRTVKNPVDFMVGTLRNLGVKSVGKPIGDSDDEPVDLLTEMGMELFEPPNVAGWPGGKRWITTGTLVNRWEFARRLAEATSGTSVISLSTMLGGLIGNGAASPAAIADAIIQRIGLDGSDVATFRGGVPLTSNQRQSVIDFLTIGGVTLNLSNESTDDANDFVRGAIALVLQAAESQIF